MAAVLASPWIANIYPAAVKDPSGAVAFEKVRAVVTPDWLVVYGERRWEGKKSPFTMFKIEADAIRPHESLPGVWVVSTADGEYIVGRGHGCGCGSSLRTMPSPLPLDL